VLNGPMVEVKDLKVSFFTKLGEVKAVDGISYQVARGKVMGIVGESGCGKSVSSFSLMGLLSQPGKIVGGEILLDGVNLTNLGNSEYEGVRGNKMAMIFQEPMTALNPVLRIGYQISEQIIKHMGFSKIQAKNRAFELLELVGIPSPQKRFHEYPHQLSGGMKQRAMIAMALSCEPEFLIADEPTTALDVTIQAQILELIQSLQKKLNMTVQFITHDLGVISEIADDVMVMYAGRIVESGSCHEIFQNPRHPYTIGLINSLPKLGTRVDELYTIPGSVPGPLELGQGCAYYNRCSKASEKCLMERPQLTGDKSKVACFFPEDHGGIN